MRERRNFLVGLAAVALAAGAVRAQAPDRAQQLQREQRLSDLDQFGLDSRIKANEMIPVGQRAYVDYGALLSVSYLTTKEGDGENRGERIYELTAYAHLNIDGVHEAFIRGRYAYYDYLSENDSFDGRGSRENRDKLDRAYYKFDLARDLQAYEGGKPGGEASIQVGRDLVYWANGLVLGERLDGVVVDVGSETLHLEAIAGVTPLDTVDIDPSRPNYDRDTKRGFYGAMATADIGEHHPFAYVLLQRDYNPREASGTGTGTDVNGDPITGKWQYDSNYFGIGSTGNLGDRFEYGVEAVYETGDSLSSPVNVIGASINDARPQAKEKIQAGALDARLEYLPPTDDYKVRLTLEETLATGDRTRYSSSNQTVFGNQKGTDDNAFQGFGLINPGLAFSPNLANLSVTRLGVSFFPAPHAEVTRRLQLGTDFFVYNKLNQAAVIDESTDESGHFLGVESDFYANWQLTSDITLVARYGIFFPSSHLTEDDDFRQFLYMGVTYAF